LPRGSWPDLGGVDDVVFYDKPFLKFERLVETYLAFAPLGYRSFHMALPLWLREKLFLKDLLRKELKTAGGGAWGGGLLFSEHHLSHAASAFYPVPLRGGRGADHGRRRRVGDHVGGDRQGQCLEVHNEIHFPHSLGLLYSAFTYYTGSR
jgi:carbamoyltransferase